MFPRTPRPLAGDHPRLVEFRQNTTKVAIMNLSEVWGVGYPTAKSLHSKTGATTIAELRAHVERDPSLLPERVRAPGG